MEDKEKYNRTRLSIFAYAYECEQVSLVSDGEYDSLANQIDLTISTDRPDLDTWFKHNYNPSTGMWIRLHPELARIRSITLSIISYLEGDK